VRRGVRQHRQDRFSRYDRMHKVVDRTRTNLEAALAAKKGLTYYQEKDGVHPGTIF